MRKLTTLLMAITIIFTLCFIWDMNTIKMMCMM